MNLQDKYAIVTGGTSGIGKAIVSHLVSKGVIVIVVARKIERIDHLKDYLGEKKSSIDFYLADLSKEKDIYNLANFVNEKYKQIDFLIHSAGAFYIGSIEESDMLELDYLYKVNFRAPYLLTKLLLDSLKRTKGQILFMNSSSGLNARRLLSKYSATKFALRGFADSLRDEVNKYGINVMNIYPGRTESPMQEKMHDMEGRDYNRGKLINPIEIASLTISLLENSETAEITDMQIRPMKKLE